MNDRFLLRLGKTVVLGSLFYDPGRRVRTIPTDAASKGSSKQFIYQACHRLPPVLGFVI